MAFDEGVAARIEDTLADRPDVIQKRMFGGMAYMVRGHMCVGVNGDELMVRVGPDGYADALAQTHAREMDFTGRAMKGFVYVAPEGFETTEGLSSWIDRGLAFVLSLPAK